MAGLLEKAKRLGEFIHESQEQPLPPAVDGWIKGCGCIFMIVIGIPGAIGVMAIVLWLVVLLFL